MLKRGELNSLKDIITKKCIEYKNCVAFLEKDKATKEFVEIKYEKLARDVIALSTALVRKYDLLGKKVAVIGENSYKWFMSYLAITTGVGLVVPLDKQLPSNEIENLIKRSDAKCIIYSGKNADEIQSIRDNLKEDVIYIDMDKEGNDDTSLSLNYLIETGKKLVDNGDNWYKEQVIDKDEFRLLMFTSGTTATSKGAMLSHGNIISNLDGATEILRVNTDDRFFSVLPMHHVYEMVVTCIYALANGSSVAICEGLKYISKDIRDAKPTVLVCVPLLVEHVVKRIEKVLKETGKEKLANRMVQFTNGLNKFGIKLKRQVFADIHKSLGGRLKYILVSAAPIEKSLIEAIEGYGYTVFQGYGLTETASIVAGTREEDRKAGTVGKPCNCEVKIEKLDDSDEGEILVKGGNVMMGYYEDKESTDEVIIDGWFHTGDLGHYDDYNNIIITGRCKNVIVTNNGKKIFPEELENEINKIDMVKESLVYGEGDASNMEVCAIVTLDEEDIKAFYGDARPDTKTIKEKIWESIKNINNKMVPYKSIKKLKTRDKDFEKTTTLKIKRFIDSNKDEQ